MLPAVGSRIGAGHGNWSRAVDSYTYQWQLCTGADGSGASDITGATDAVYVVQEADSGSYLRAVVTAALTGGGTASLGSVVVGPIGTIPVPSPDFLGNSFDGDAWNMMVASAVDLAVAPDGATVTCANWDESAHDVMKLSPSGVAGGPFPGNSSGRLRENGEGPYAVHVDDTYIWAAQSESTAESGLLGVRKLIRWARSTWDATDSGTTLNGTTLAVSGSGTFMGMTVVGSELFVTDAGTALHLDGSDVSPDTTLIRVFNADLTGSQLRSWTVARARKLAVDREGELWVLQQKTATHSARVVRYTTGGTATGDGFDVSGYPMALACHPTTDELWIADNDTAQCVRRFQYDGTELSAFGSSYLSGATPGLVGGTRFCGPRGVGFDSTGNVYVLQSYNPAHGDIGWLEPGVHAQTSKFEPDGTLVWATYGASGAPGELLTDKSRAYVNYLTYARQPSDGRYVAHACNFDPFTNPTDPRLLPRAMELAAATFTTFIREISGNRFLFRLSSDNTKLEVYRFDGEIAVWSQTFDSGGAGKCYFPALNGDVWYADANLAPAVYPLTGFDGSGNPTYGSLEQMAFPTPFNKVFRLDARGSVIYVMGFSAANPWPEGTTDDWKMAGAVVARYDSLPTVGGGWPTATWQITVPTSSAPDYTIGLAAEGGTLGIAYLAGGTSLGQGHIRLYDTADGSFVSDWEPPSTYGGNWGFLDMLSPICLSQGRMLVEGNGENKTLIFTP